MSSIETNSPAADLRVVFLGTGSAEGVPVLGCSCDTCVISARRGGKHIRTRTSLLVQHKDVSLLIDAGPDMYVQLVRMSITRLDALVLTHWHYDHFGGVAGFMYWDRHNADRKPIPMYLSQYSAEGFANYCQHLFPGEGPLEEKYRPLLAPVIVSPGDRHCLGTLKLTFYSLPHGIPGNINCRIDAPGASIALAYDTGPEISTEARRIMEGATVGIVEAAYPDHVEPSEKHLRVREAIQLGKSMGWEQIYLVHISHFSEPHAELVDYVANVGGEQCAVAWDGMKVVLKNTEK